MLACWLGVQISSWAGATEPPLAPVPSGAIAHHQRGLVLYDSGAYERALAEFTTAYRLSSNYQLLFNIAQLHLRLEHWALARETLERYSSQGGAALPAARREQVQRQLAELAQRTALLVLELDGTHTELEFQGRQLASSARSETIAVDPGHFQLLASRSGFAPIAREIDAEAGAVLPVSLRFTHAVPPPPAPASTDPMRIVAWSAAGTLGLGAAGAALGTVLASRHYEQLRARPATGSTSAARERLDAQRALVRHLAVTSDVLTVAGIAVGAIALYYTLHDGGSPDSTLALQLTPAALQISGEF